MDDTLPADFADAAQSSRWYEIRSRMTTTLASLPEAYRASELKIVLMTPSQATEAWLSWGREDESGRNWERRNRHDLKQKLFGNPPRGMVAKAQAARCSAANKALDIRDKYTDSNVSVRALSDLHGELVAIYGHYAVMIIAIGEWRNVLNKMLSSFPDTTRSSRLSIGKMIQVSQMQEVNLERPLAN